jgi:hypothetical protein
MNETVGDDCFPCGIGPFSEVGLPGRMQACTFHKSFTHVEVTFFCNFYIVYCIRYKADQKDALRPEKLSTILSDAGKCGKLC